jgi:hypothetical protein
MIASGFLWHRSMKAILAMDALRTAQLSIIIAQGVAQGD